MKWLIIIGISFFSFQVYGQQKNCNTFKNNVRQLVDGASRLRSNYTKEISGCFINGSNDAVVSRLATSTNNVIKNKVRSSISGYKECIKGALNPAAVNWFVENLYKKMGEEFAALVLYCSSKGQKLIPKSDNEKVNFNKLQEIVKSYLKL